MSVANSLLFIDREQNITSYATQMMQELFQNLEVIIPNCKEELKMAVLANVVSLDANIELIDKKIQAVAKDRDLHPRFSELTLFVEKCMGFLLHAQKLSTEIDNDRAWAYLLNAQKWLSYVTIICMHEKATEITMDGIRHRSAQKAAKAKDSQIDYLRDEAYRLVLERHQLGHPWRSKRNAAITITPKLVEYTKKLNDGLEKNQKKYMGLVGENAYKTVASWLKKMPDHDQVFAKRSRKK